MELEKLNLYYKSGDEITRDALENIIARYMEDNKFKFVDAVINNDYQTSLNILNDFKIQKIEPIVLLSLLVREYRLMLISKDLYQGGYSNNKIGTELGLQDWQVEKIIRNAYNLSIEYLEDKLVSFTDLDYQIKSGKVDKYLGLEMFILKEQ